MRCRVRRHPWRCAPAGSGDDRRGRASSLPTSGHRDGRRRVAWSLLFTSSCFVYSTSDHTSSRHQFGTSRGRAMMTPSAEPLTGAKMRLVEYLKRVEAATAPELAATFGLTDTAVRQHLEALEAAGLGERP